VDVKNPNRGPLLIISGTNDTTAPRAFTHGSYKKQLQEPRNHRVRRDRRPRALTDHSITAGPNVANPRTHFPQKRFL